MKKFQIKELFELNESLLESKTIQISQESYLICFNDALVISKDSSKTIGISAINEKSFIIIENWENKTITKIKLNSKSVVIVLIYDEKRKLILIGNRHGQISIYKEEDLSRSIMEISLEGLEGIHTISAFENVAMVAGGGNSYYLIDTEKKELIPTSSRLTNFKKICSSNMSQLDGKIVLSLSGSILSFICFYCISIIT